MKLGFWNRLALVLGVVGTFAFPTWWALSTNLRQARVMGEGYQTCVAAAAERTDAEGWQDCREFWLEGTSYIGWEAWWQSVAWAVPAMLIIYALIWVAVWIAKWVWRGREKPE